jgi:hypothetical protein
MIFFGVYSKRPQNIRQALPISTGKRCENILKEVITEGTHLTMLFFLAPLRLRVKNSQIFQPTQNIIAAFIQSFINQSGRGHG